ncbi:MAG: hypothetical protein ACT4QA_17610 [Panacagrimonas sp.]
MSSNSFASTVDLSLRSSALAHQILFWLHVLPLVLLGFSGAPGAAGVGVAFGIALSWVWLRRHPAFGHGPKAITRLTWHADGRWTLHFGARSVDAELLGSSYVHTALLILNFRAGTRRHTRILFGDEAAGDALRRLRARLATTSQSSEESSSS